jgi:hypothetical protein
MTNEIVAASNQGIMAAEGAYQVHEGFFNSLDLTTVEGKLASVNAYNAAESLSKHVGEVLEVIGAFTTPGIRAARGAGQEDTPCQNTYLLTKDGKSYFSQSDGVARSINMIASVFGSFYLSDEVPYLPISCIEDTLPNGNTLKKLVVVQ